MNSDNPFYKEEKTKSKNTFGIAITVIATLVTILVVLYFFVFTPNEVNGPSMEPNFHDGESLLVSRPYRWLYDTPIGDSLGIKFDRGDVVVFTLPGEGDIVKRIIGVPGDTIQIRDGVFFVNGSPVREAFEIKNTERNDGAALKDGITTLRLEEDEFFLAGDNRDGSYDSREIGPVPIDQIKGKVIFRIAPMDSFGFVGDGDLGVKD